MGYTHYFKTTDIEETTWKLIIKDCKKLYKYMPRHSKSSGGYHSEDPLYINGCSQFKAPQFNKEHIYFNGADNDNRLRKGVKTPKGEYGYTDSRDLAYETFAVYPNMETGEFCKTERKPYDLMVQACLIVIDHHTDNTAITSDGTNADWKEARNFVKDILGYKSTLKIK
jgi:hypothetical protein